MHLWLSSDCDITVAQIQIQIQIQNNRAALMNRCKSPIRKQMFRVLTEIYLNRYGSWDSLEIYCTMHFCVNLWALDSKMNTHIVLTKSGYICTQVYTATYIFYKNINAYDILLSYINFSLSFCFVLLSLLFILHCFLAPFDIHLV